jgi:hypothetical protein
MGSVSNNQTQLVFSIKMQVAIPVAFQSIDPTKNTAADYYGNGSGGI